MSMGKGHLGAFSLLYASKRPRIQGVIYDRARVKGERSGASQGYRV